jgi:hypothetical protein
MNMLFACLFLMTALATAAPIEAYLASRDRDIAAANREKAPLSNKALQRATGDLERRLRRLVPPLSAQGFKPTGKSNVTTLTREQGFGQLDGLVFTSQDDKTSVVVTTKPLLETWIKAHANWWPNDVNVPQTVDAALQAEVLYTQAISTDAAVAKFAEIPVAKPAEASFAFVMLDIRRQDIGRDMPNEIFAAVIRGDTVLIASQPLAKALSPIPACERIWTEAAAKADAAMADYRAHHLGNDTVFEAAQKLSNDGDLAHRRCVAEMIKDQAEYQPLLRQAQALVDLLK